MAKINNEKLMNKSILCKTFIEHLRDIIKTEKGITKEEIEKKVNTVILIILGLMKKLFQ